LRGVKQESETITSKMGGKFMAVPALREEFLALVR
jgi:GTP cyclohydrolase I